MMHRYTYFCKKCGHHEECPSKADWDIVKKNHKRRGCDLSIAPVDGGMEGYWVLARPDLASDLKEVWDKRAKEREENEQENDIDPGSDTGI